MAKSRNQVITSDEVSAIPAIIENSGLCGTCENTMVCMYLGDVEHPVLECEEFTHHRADGTRPAARHRNLAAVPKPEAEDEKLPLAMGICSDCENHATCMFDRPECGVWQCEEYS